MTGDIDRRGVLRARATTWRAIDPDARTRADVDSMLAADDLDALESSFGSCVSFGTAGLRAPMGPGPARMNSVVVRRATVGLMRTLGASAAVVIGHDARDNSARFAQDTARVVAAEGGRALVLPPFAPTPLVAFAVRHLGADAGVAITASHNPPDDNGYKVYLADGAQIVAPADAEIARVIGTFEMEVAVAPVDDPRIEHLDDSVESDYVEHVVALPTSTPTPPESRGAKVVYSPLHGVGGRFMAAAFDRAGLGELVTVDSQATPDPTFPTVRSPNPEDSHAQDAARELAVALDADVALVHDPDADRLGVVAEDLDGWRPLSGDEIGLLLADFVLGRTSGSDRLVVDTLVSSTALARLAEAHGVVHRRSLTGFKWIVREALHRPDLRFVFGYEEALGYSVDAYVRDKDAISAALAFTALVCELRSRGRTVGDRLRELAMAHGLFTTASWTLAATSEGGLHAVMAAFRRTVPARVGGHSVVRVEDFASAGELPPTDLLVLHLEPEARVALRPSGTEAKLKIYAEVVRGIDPADDYLGARAAARTQIDRLHDSIVPLLQNLMPRT